MAFEDEDKKRFKVDALNRRQAELAKEKLSDFKSTWKLKEEQTFSIFPWILGFVVVAVILKVFLNSGNDKAIIANEEIVNPISEISKIEPIQLIKPLTNVLSTEFSSESATCPLTLIADNKNYYVKLCDALNANRTVAKFFVNAGDTLKTKIPAGRYMIKFGGGNDWYGEEELFGAFSQYGQSETLDFTFDGMTSTGHTIVFQKMVNGNFHTDDVGRDTILQDAE